MCFDIAMFHRYIVRLIPENREVGIYSFGLDYSIVN